MSWSTRQRRQRLAAVVVLMTGIIATAVATQRTITLQDSGSREWLAERGEVVASATNDTVGLALDGLSSVAAFLENTTSVSQASFSGFVESLDPEIWLLGVAYLPIVPAADLDAHEAAERISRPGYTVSDLSPDGPVPVERGRDVYYPVAHFVAGPALSSQLVDGETRTTDGLIAVGYDAGLRPEWLPGLEFAVATDGPGVSGFLEIVSPTGERFGQAFIVSVPVHDEDGAVVGLVAAPMLDVLLAIGGDTTLTADVEWTIEDTAGPSLTKDASLWETTLSFPGMTWGLDVTTSGDSGFRGLMPWWVVAAAGMAITGLVTALYLVAGQRARSRAQVEEMRRFNEAKDRFLASVSHEVRTPLSVVVGLARQLGEKREEYGDEELDEMLSLIAGQGDEMSAIIDDLLVAARADIGEVQLSPAQIDLGEQAHAATRALGTPIPITGESMPAWADGRRVRQIVRNLITNAVKYGGAERQIRLGGNGDSVWIEVADSGPPIDADRSDRMFEAYVTTGVDSEENIGAIGLGLYVSRHLARSSGGDLTYCHDGEFGVFRLSVPRANPPTEDRDSADGPGETASVPRSMSSRDHASPAAVP